MTDPDLADATYIEPITPEIVEQIIAREKPDALLPTMGGQTALNTAMALARDGTLGTLRRRADRRQRGRDRQGRGPPAVQRRDGRRSASNAPRSRHRPHDRRGRAAALDEIGLPAIIRPRFTLGGTGGGIAYNREEFEEIVARRPRRLARPTRC